MDQTKGKVLLERWIEDAGFREQMRTDALGTIAASGVELTDEDREFLAAVDWTLSDEELEALLEKKLMC